MSAKGGRGEKKKQVSKSEKAGVQFPVTRLGRYLRKGRYAARIGAGAPVYTAAVLEVHSLRSCRPLPSLSCILDFDKDLKGFKDCPEVLFFHPRQIFSSLCILLGAITITST